MKTASRKAKGRRLQNLVCEGIMDVYGDVLTEGDVRGAIMGESGEDVKRSPLAKEIFPYSIECKNQESLSIWKALNQAEENAENGDTPAVVFKRNRSKAYIAMSFDDFLEVLRRGQ